MEFDTVTEDLVLVEETNEGNNHVFAGNAWRQQAGECYLGDGRYPPPRLALKPEI